ncbi:MULTISPECIES: hypothetical protein [unclassified Caulobacter]|uniref:hypothetical protein n=1 Tax=unclassified Caulobacter TaxID=2648921 RepID=UPI000D3AA44D|nr:MULTISPECIES: hypothetical protein [unclassified Caulobacter]PTS88166.1 hypothetical protein DBR21_10340 [Caulobacter sp. HMWF009]PTT06965.1 hypothetical protein DBR10_10850 [Caulobacter sp. HMWF025]PTT77793.1 hypothetical protein DBR41_23890 [Pseudomonas sp. HMWF010]
MKVAAVAFSVLGTGLLGFAYGLAVWAGMPANPLATLGMLLGYSGALIKLALMVLGLQLIAILAVAVPRLLKPSVDPDRSLLTVFSFLPPGVGLAASLLDGLTILNVMQRTNTTSLMVIAPSLAEAIMPLALGLLIGALAAVALVRLGLPQRQASQ